MATGVYVCFSAEGMATVGADCVFARNAGGDVVRQEEEEIGEDEEEEYGEEEVEGGEGGEEDA